MKILKAISKTKSDEILIALSKQNLTFGKIARLVNHPALATIRLKELKKFGLIEREVMQNELRTVEYSLTEKGKIIANALKTISEFEKEK